MNALFACAVCMQPGHPTSKAIGVAIVILLAFLLPVLGGFVALIVTLARRAKAARLADESAEPTC